MTTITKLLEEYRNGSADACEEILKRMMPLAKKYAGKIHCMDYEDALQELCLTILEALTHLDPACPEGKCISYIETSVINRYYALCKRYLSAPETENIDDTNADLPDSFPTTIPFSTSSITSGAFRKQAESAKSSPCFSTRISATKKLPNGCKCRGSM